MQRTFSVVLLSLLLLSPVPLAAADTEEAAAPEQYRVHLQEFFGRVEKGEYREAIEAIFGTNPWMEKAADQVANLKTQFSGLPDLAGELHGYDLIGEQHFSDSFVYLYYIVEYDRTPISFHFTFYKPTDTWRLYTFEYKEDLGELAFELLKMKLIFPTTPDESRDTTHRQALTTTPDGLGLGSSP